MERGWNLIDSDPAVFTELLESFGVRGLEFNEFFELGDFNNSNFNPLINSSVNKKNINALIFTFRYDPEALKKLYADFKFEKNTDKIFFTRQIADKACATYAIINTILNLQPNADTLPKNFDLGETFSFLRDATAGMSSNERGELIANTEEIKSLHNNFAAPNSLEFIKNPLQNSKRDQNACHFVAFVPINGHLIELDGLKPFPVNHGKLESDRSWLFTAHTAIMKYINSFQATENEFCLLSLVPNRLDALRQQLLSFCGSEIERSLIKNSIENEISDREKSKRMNEYRRMNFFPILAEIVKEFAAQGELFNLM